MCPLNDGPVFLYLVFLIYFLQVENWCPRLPWRVKTPYEEADHNSLVSGLEALSLHRVFRLDTKRYTQHLSEVPAEISSLAGQIILRLA